MPVWKKCRTAVDRLRGFVNCQLSEFDPEVEGDQWLQNARGWQVQVLERTREAKAVNQSESEDDHPAPGSQLARHDILDRDHG